MAISGYMGRLSLYSYSYHILENLAGNTSILVFKKFRFLVEPSRGEGPGDDRDIQERHLFRHA